MVRPRAGARRTPARQAQLAEAVRDRHRAVAADGPQAVQAQLAALLSGGDTVQADEELGAVVGVSVLGVGVELSELVDGSSLGTLESAVGF